ncbi:hypothetical protein BCV70DRAFT_202675 [Testicularia cyperi]|uniref:RING-type domain-containing protein n=1 Tax=Testicularia cyperi TaxID=1882483 RepID=A0A317XHI7_9BASI|nr:hypothetical protein BCV70DRAFT_202675 [Testicularia cyperi]
MSDQDAGPSRSSSQSHAPRPALSISRRRSSGARSARPRTGVSRAASVVSTRSDSSNISSGLNRLSWNTGDCYDYVDAENQISAFLQCPICLGPFLDPFVSEQCSHTFCRHCITIAVNGDSSSGQTDSEEVPAPRCPSCRTPVRLDDFKPTALLIKNMVDTLRVRCPNKSKGCTYICERHLLQGHVAKSCEYEYVDQDFEEGKRCGCSEKVMRKDWHTHGLTCPKRKVTCETCDQELCFDEMEEHTTTCSPEPVSCSFCTYSTIKSRLPMHISECPLAPASCPHSIYGCSWQGSRWQLGQPTTTDGCSSSDHHLSACRFEPLKAFFNIFDQQTSELKSENAALRRRLNDLENRQRSQARRTDDCIHSLGGWYRSAGDVAGPAPRGSQAGVDGEWDEFPLDAQNWERSLSQHSFAGRQTRSQSLSGAGSRAPDLSRWLAQPAYRDPGTVADPSSSFSPPISRSGSSYFPPSVRDETVPSSGRYLAPPTSRSMPTSSPHDMSVFSRSEGAAAESSSSYSRASDTHHRRSFTTSATTQDSVPTRDPRASYMPVVDMDRTNLDTALASLTASVTGLSVGIGNLDKRSEESHLTAVQAGFDAARAQEEVASVRHALHAVRMQIHQMLMQQQRYALFSPTAASALSNEPGSSANLAAQPPMREPGIPLLTPPLLMRRWGGFDQTKL